MRNRLKVGLIGCGNFGSAIVPYIQQAADIAALCDPKVDAAESLAQRHELEARTFTDYRQMFREVRLDAAFVTAGNFAHAEITIAAAEAGLHVFWEKAMARTVPECWEMVRACQEHEVKLMIGHKRRLRPPWARLIELTRPGAVGGLGEPLAITVCQYSDRRPYDFFDTWWGDPALCGGHFHLQGVHVVDWFAAMCGRVTKVTAMYGAQHDSRYKMPDICHATYQFQSGVLASIQGALAYPLHQFRESQGPWGQCRHGGFKLVPFLDHIDLYWQRLDEDRRHHERFDDLGFDHAYRLEIGDFVRWITEDRPPCLTWSEGLRCVEMMEGAYRSAEAGGEPVSFPLYPELEEPGT